MVELLEEAILGLDRMPFRGSIRRNGIYTRRYRQLFVKNFTIIYRIDEDKKNVIIVTIRYTGSSF